MNAVLGLKESLCVLDVRRGLASESATELNRKGLVMLPSRFSDPISFALFFVFCFVLCGRPDMTFAVDWALNNNYLSFFSFCVCKQLNKGYRLPASF